MCSNEHPNMHGNWVDGPDWDECETCEGRGELANDFGRIVSCPDCQGIGYIEPEDARFDDDVI